MSLPFGAARADGLPLLYAAATPGAGHPLRVQFTLGIEPRGMNRYNLGVLRKALVRGVVVSLVNLMVFDYYLGGERKPLHMGMLAIEAATSAHCQLARSVRSTSHAGTLKLTRHRALIIRVHGCGIRHGFGDELHTHRSGRARGAGPACPAASR